jgi:hypothetical protein
VPVYRFYFDVDKANEVLLYVAQHITNKNELLPILYLADKKHLSKYGRFIAGDWYFAHILGPMGYNMYHILQNVNSLVFSPVKNAFNMLSRITIMPLRMPDMSFLSESDVKCLDGAIQQYKDLSFTEFRNLAYDDAYKATPLNAPILLDDIVKTLPDSEMLLEYLAG